jgi:hypothetical protein
MRGFLFYFVFPEWGLIVPLVPLLVDGLVLVPVVEAPEVPGEPPAFAPVPVAPPAPAPPGVEPLAAPAAEFPEALPPAAVPPCASAKVLVNASAPASAMVDSFMVVSSWFLSKSNRGQCLRFRPPSTQ